MIKKNLILILIITLFASCGSTQQKGSNKYYTDSRKAIKHFEGALVFYREGRTADALDFLDRAIKKDENFIDAYVLKGNIYGEKRNHIEALKNYQKAYDIDKNHMPKLLYIMAKIELYNGMYKEAFDHISRYDELLTKDPTLQSQINQIYNRSKFALDQIKNPVPFKPVNMGSNINSKYDDYVNSLSTDEQTMIITVKLPKDKFTNDQRKNYEEDFYYSVKNKSDEWMPVKRMSQQFNTNGDEGAMKISPDNSHILFASNYRRINYGRFDIYFSKRIEDNWGETNNIGPGINTANWESQATMSADGNTIYFVRKYTRSKNGSDIFYSTKDPVTGEWRKGKNLGKPINTDGNEMAPFLHPDGKTLYFSSDSHIGMGKFDFFYSRKDANGNWSEPVNLGYPINTKNDEIGMIINARGNLAFISSEREGGYGKLDIYQFELYPEAQAERVNYMRGNVYDAETKRPLFAEFELVDLKSGEIIINSHSDKNTGSFFVCLPTSSEYALSVDKKNYLFHSESFSLDGIYNPEKPFVKNIYLKPIKEGEIIVLRNIYFETAKYNLKEKSFVELNKLIKLLKNNKEMNIEIRGHTDNVGSAEDNMKLSENRAKSVYNYLVENGIDKNRLSWKGFGQTKPIADNDSKEGRAKNRRTEIKVLK